ncbi:hypothetical protein QR685DRAFT_157705 [Neurospora intermedia]|uniref:Uncharacterized protein n=1 Tax=Neurospora intermedia TaxID=5142 RepID=A0ABR3DJW3_NEUIN
MPVATSPSAVPRPTTVKMEDRKRPAANADDVAPPSKRQAVNGTSKSKDDSNDSREEAWIEDSLFIMQCLDPAYSQIPRSLTRPRCT